uniref:Secreted protein n=1 Tax=Echinococcus granulosus TaxID=6210 RepID=A0A068W937_ECHGR|nr:hypothetical protein EgrG_000897700 [Echinococcus granulosus]
MHLQHHCHVQLAFSFSSVSTLLHFLCCGNGFRPPLQLTCISARVLIGSHELKA